VHFSHFFFDKRDLSFLSLTAMDISEIHQNDGWFANKAHNVVKRYKFTPSYAKDKNFGDS